MKDNLLEMNSRGLTATPVLLGGAALTRAYVEQDLNELFEGEVRYARDAFEGLSLMDAVMAVKRGERGRPCRSPPEAPGGRSGGVEEEQPVDERRSDVARDVDVPAPPFWGSRVVKGVKLADVAAWLDHRATFMGQWGLRGTKETPYEALVESEGLPRLRMWLDRIATDGLAEFAVSYGLLAVLLRGQRAGGLRPGLGGLRGARLLDAAAPVHVPAAAARPAAVPGRLLPRRRGGRPEGSGRHRVPARHDGVAGGGGDRAAVRRQLLPRLPGTARAVGAAHRGARRGVARPRPGGTGARRGWQRRRDDPRPGPRGRGTASATRPAPTWRIARSWSIWCAPSESVSPCRRNCSSIPNNPPTPSSSITRKPSTSMR